MKPVQLRTLVGLLCLSEGYKAEVKIAGLLANPAHILSMPRLIYDSQCNARHASLLIW